jgi:reverse gyrase
MKMKKKRNSKVISIMTECIVCGKEVTKKNYNKDMNAYLCDKCVKNIPDLNKIVELYEKLLDPDLYEDDEKYQELLKLLDNFKKEFEED